MSDPVARLNAALEGRYKIVRGLGEPGRLRWMLGVAAVLAFLVARPLLAADISGTWEISYQMAQGRQTITLELVHEGSRVSGSGTMRADSMGDALRVEVRSGTAGNSDFSFLLVEEGGSAYRPQEFIGAWYRDEMSGETEGAFGTGMFTGVRERMGN